MDAPLVSSKQRKRTLAIRLRVLQKIESQRHLEPRSAESSASASRPMITTTVTFLFRSPLRTDARCVLYYNTILARGPAGRVPVASPPGCWCSWGIEPPSHQQNVSPFYHSQSSGRCITSQGSVPAAPDNPMTRAAFHSPLDPSRPKGRTQLSLWKPIDQPCADWMRVSVSAAQSRPAFRLLDFRAGFSPLHHDQGPRPWIRLPKKPRLCLALGAAQTRHPPATPPFVLYL